MRGEQDQHVIGDIKHYAINDQENGRYAVNANIDQRSMRESDLLAFEIALENSHAAAVMCSYNRVNGDYALRGNLNSPPPRRSQEGFQFSGICRFRLGRGPQHSQGFARGARYGAA